MTRASIFIISFVILIISCVPPTDEVITEVKLDFSDPSKQSLYNLIDRQDVDSILQYTSHPDPAYRYLVGAGFSTIQSDNAIDSLAVLLKDPVALVRAKAAYALGQIGDTKVINPLMDAFVNKDTTDVNNITNCQILEAIGKAGNASLLKSMATVSTYKERDSLLLLGQARGIYRFALRGITASEGTDLMVEYATSFRYPNNVRLIAANYLARASDIPIDDYKFRIAETMKSENNIYIKIALASSLKKTNDPEIFAVLLNEFNASEDYRYKVNLLRTMTAYNYISAVEVSLANLSHPNLHVATTAAEYLISKGNSSDANIYRNFITDSLHWQVKSTLYSAILKHLPRYYARTKAILKNEIVGFIETTENDYEKAAYIRALSFDPQNYLLMKEIGFTGNPLLKSTSMSGLGRILKDENFTREFRNNSRNIQRQIVAIILEGVQTGDAGMVAIAGTILKDPAIDIKNYVSDITILEDALNKLSLPKEIESYNELGEAIAFIKGETFIPKALEYNHPIDWKEVNAVSDSTLVHIRTSKGVISIELYPRTAPGSVANFASLCKQGFYNGKVFHRVVSNFVVQTGCPRGDGYGSLDYSIRSELSNNYYDDEGYVGMASAGKNTEGTQWFITHSPTPHLDGRYTIFAKVVEGMNVVHDINVGDTIEEIIFR